MLYCYLFSLIGMETKQKISEITLSEGLNGIAAQSQDLFCQKLKSLSHHGRLAIIAQSQMEASQSLVSQRMDRVKESFILCLLSSNRKNKNTLKISFAIHCQLKSPGID